MTKEKNEIAVENKKRNKKEFSGLASLSFFVALLDRLSLLIYDALINGFFGKIFSSYSALQKKFTKGFCGGYVLGSNKIRKALHTARVFVASKIESGFFVTRARKGMKYLCSLPLNTYGTFFLFFGIYTAIVYLVKFLVPELGAPDKDYLIIGVITMLVAIPLTFSRNPLAFCVKRSVIGNMIFHGAFGFSNETFQNGIVKRKVKGSAMFLLGLVAGILTIFVHPLTIILTLLSIVLICLVAVSPEIGVLLSILLVPILSFVKYPTVCLCGFILVTAFFYLLKVIRGKRLLKLEILDVFVLLFGFLIFCSGFFGAGGSASISSALVTCVLMLGYFLLVNLLRTEKWIKRCVFALVGSAALTAMIGIFEYVFGEQSSAWLDTSLFSDIKLRVVSLFENPNVLATFIVMIFPFALALRLLSTKSNEKWLLFIVCLSMIVCTVFTWSRGAWLAMIIGLLVFYIIYSKRSLRIFGAILVVIPILPIVIPNNVLNRFLSITNLLDSSISYRIYTWKGTVNMIGDYLFGGVGFGNEAFQQVYPNYAYAGMESAEHSHSLFLQILATTGIFGLIVLCIVLFLNFQKCFEYIKAPENRASRIYVSAVVSAMVSVLIMGVFDYVWYNFRVFYIFWIILAIGCAFVRVGNREAERKRSYLDELDQY